MGHRLRFLSAADLALAGVAEGAGAEELVEEMVDDDDAGTAVLLDAVEVEAGVAEVVEEMVDDDDAGTAVSLDAVEVEADAAGAAGIAELDHC